MAIIGSVIKRSFELRERLPKIRKKDGYKQQTKVLKKLLAKAEFTAFGEHYNFSKIMKTKNLCDRINVYKIIILILILSEVATF